MNPLRGQVWDVDVPDVGRKPFLVVSNNGRNQNFNDVLAVRVSTSPPKREHPTVIALSASDRPLVGSVICNDLQRVAKSLFIGSNPRGSVTYGTLQRVEDGLRAALGLSR